MCDTKMVKMQFWLAQRITLLSSSERLRILSGLNGCSL